MNMRSISADGTRSMNTKHLPINLGPNHKKDQHVLNTDVTFFYMDRVHRCIESLLIGVHFSVERKIIFHRGHVVRSDPRLPL